MPRSNTFTGLLVSSTLMLAAWAEPHSRQSPAPDLNPVIRWNRIANEIFPVDVGPVLDSRAMAILQPFTMPLTAVEDGWAAGERVGRDVARTLPPRRR
jgi:hypothetical protein